MFQKFSHISKGFQNFDPGLRSGLWSRPRQRTPDVSFENCTWFWSTLAPHSYYFCKENFEPNFYREKEHMWGPDVSHTIFFLRKLNSFPIVSGRIWYLCLKLKQVNKLWCGGGIVFVLNYPWLWLSCFFCTLTKLEAWYGTSQYIQVVL